jgi:hypothetical protein
MGRPSEGEPSLTEGLTTTRNWENIVMVTTNVDRIQTEKKASALRSTPERRSIPVSLLTQQTSLLNY